MHFGERGSGGDPTVGLHVEFLSRLRAARGIPLPKKHQQCPAADYAADGLGPVGSPRTNRSVWQPGRQ
jgi:hypothetical protein